VVVFVDDDVPGVGRLPVTRIHGPQSAPGSLCDRVSAPQTGFN
jgi:hypothetical protein